MCPQSFLKGCTGIKHTISGSIRKYNKTQHLVYYITYGIDVVFFVFLCYNEKYISV